jgi:hypothetical protein
VGKRPPRKISKAYPCRRTYSLRRAAAFSTGEKEIEKVFRLPEGSVWLHLRNGRSARTDKSIDSLLKEILVGEWLL